MTHHNRFQNVTSEGYRTESLRVLNTLYDRAKGIADVSDYSQILAARLNIDHSTLIDLARYLEGKGLVKLGIKASGIDYRLISLTKEGVVEIEAARENRETPILGYPPGTISQVVNYGNIIQNSPNVSNTQVYATNDLEKVKQFLALLGVELPHYDLNESQKLEAEADAKSIGGQVLSPKPRFNIIRELGQHILDVVKPVASEGLKEIGNSAFSRG